MPNFDMCMMALFNKIGTRLDEALGLACPDNEVYYETPDRVSVGGSDGFTSVDQMSVTAAVVGSHQIEPLRTSVDKPGSKQTQGEKFYLIYTGTWNSTMANLNQVARIDVVGLLKNVAHAVDGLLKYHTYIRFGLEVMVQINPTSFQQGGLICALIPGSDRNISMAALTMFPHGLLNCNINNVVRIKVPFVHTRGAHRLDDQQYTPWWLLIRVWSRLEIAAETTSECTITVLARFCDLEMHGLTPLHAQMMRSEVRISSSLNVVNLSNFEDSRAKISFALDQEHFRTDESSAGGVKLRNFSTWTRTPTLMTQFPFNSSTTTGTQIAVYPVSPYHYMIQTANPKEDAVTSLASVSQMFCYWRGDIVFHFQVFPTRYHAGRLLFAFVPGNEKTDVSHVTLLQATSGLCAVMDINGTSSTMVFRVPWISDTPYRVNTYTTSHNLEGRFSAIGKLIVFCYNRLTHPANVQGHVWVNVYVSAVNLELFSPIYQVVPVAQAGEDDNSGFNTGGYAEQGSVDEKPLDPTKPEVSPPTGAVTAIEDPELAKKRPQTFPQEPHGIKRHTSDHMDMRKFMGRGHFLCQFTFNGSKVYTVPLNITTANKPPKAIPSTLRWFFSLFHLYRGPLDLTLVFNGKTDVDGLMWFTPVGMAVEGTWTEVSPALIADYTTSLGMVRFNTRRTGNVQVRIPWYTNLYAISANLKDDAVADNSLGALSIQVDNSPSDYVTCAVYVSVTEESEFYFPRAPLSNDMVTASNSTLMKREMLLESSVDEPRQEEDNEFEDALENFRGASRPVSPYRDVRMRVGAMRLAYAKQQLYSQSVMLNGDIVKRVDKNWVFFGVFYEGKVYHPDCEPRALQRISLFDYGMIRVVEPNGWDMTDVRCSEDVVTKWIEGGFHTHKFNFPSFCRRNFEKAFNTHYAVMKQVVGDAIDNLFDRLVPDERNVFDHVVGDSSTMKDLQSDVKVVTDECVTFIQQMKQYVNQFASAISKSRAPLICRTMLGLCKVAVAIYVSVKSDWKPNIAIPMMGSLAIDVALVGCDMVSVLQELLKKHVDIELESQSRGWLRDLVAGITVIRTVKDALMWVVEKIQTWYSSKYGAEKERLEAVSACEDEIETLLDICEHYLIATDDTNASVDMGFELLSKLRTVGHVCLKDKETMKFHNMVRQTQIEIVKKLRTLNSDSVRSVVRPEPVVCYIAGARGGGKTLLSMCLAVKICKMIGVDYKTNIYTKPIGSQYWDGYANQLVCIIDDIGQCTDDSDWVDFCQLVSGCPMRLNMASLEEKGKHFTSPFIICTSNQVEPCPKTVYVKDAILRRLHYRLLVKPTEEFTSVEGMLNVEKAKRMGHIEDMSCVSISCQGCEISVDEVLELLMATKCSRDKNMTEFMDLWAQSDNDLQSALKAIIGSPSEMRKSRFSQLFDWMRNHRTIVIGTALSAFAAIVGISVAAYYVFKSTTHTTEAAYNVAQRPRNIVRLGQSEQFSNSVIEVSNLIRKNLVRFGVGRSEEEVHWTLNGLGIKQDWLLVPSHGYKFELETINYFFLEKNDTFYCLSKDKVEIVSIDVGFQDVVLMRFPGIPPFRDITDHFVSRDNLQLCSKKLATLCTNNAGLFQMITEGNVILEESAEYKHKTETGEVVTLKIGQAFRGKGEAMPGSCGGALVSANNKLQNPICGIHVAAGSGQMLSKAVWKEMFAVLDKPLHSQRICKIEYGFPRINLGSKTAIHKSPVYDLVQDKIKRMPAALPYNKHSAQDPIQVMLSKYSTPEVVEPEDYCDAVSATICRINSTLSVERGSLTMCDAIFGVEGMDGIDMKTSPGYPYVLYGLDKPKVFSDMELFLDLYNDMRCALERGQPADIVFVTCAKDELREFEKVELGKTRAIEAAPVHFVVFVRQCFGKLVAAMQMNPGWHICSAVGMDPDSDWNSMVASALRFGDKVIDLDFANFDASLSSFMIIEACVIMGSVVGLDLSISKAIGHTIAHSVHQVGDMRYTVQGAMPSGTPCTSLLNSLINQTNVFWCLKRVVNLDYYDLFQLFKVLCYGDDVLIVPRRDITDFECQRISVGIQEEMAKLGLTATGSDKGPVKVKPLLELEFLKRKTAVVLDRFVPRIREDVVWCLLAWRRKGATMQDNVDDARWFAILAGDFDLDQKICDVVRVGRLDVQLRPRTVFWTRVKNLEIGKDFDIDPEFWYF